MFPYVRLAYASTATANPAHIRKDLIQISESARQHNLNHQLTGVLLYGNGYFFQCIEGHKTQVDALYQHLLKDSRHEQVSLLSYENREQSRFDQWGLRYTHADPQIQGFLSQHRLASFNPYLLHGNQLLGFMDVLYQHAQSNKNASNQALEQLEAGQSGYIMSLKDMATVGTLLLLMLLPLYLIVTLLPGKSGFFLF